MKKIDRTGEIGHNKNGTKMKIIEYVSYNKIIVEFQDEYKAKVSSQYGEFKKGKTRNPYDKNVFGVGYMGEGEYTEKTHFKIYNTWKAMLGRCYDPYCLNKEPSYIDCYVEKHLHNFQNFAKWYEENYYEIEGEIMCLDKDILKKGNKIYNRECMVFVPKKINNLFIKRQNDRGKYPIGVTEKSDGTKLRVRCNIFIEDKNKEKYLGCFSLDKPFQAFTCYKQFKENYIKQIANEYKDLIPQKLYDAMCQWEVEIND